MAWWSCLGTAESEEPRPLRSVRIAKKGSASSATNGRQYKVVVDQLPLIDVYLG